MKIDKKIAYKLLTFVFLLDSEALVLQELPTEGPPYKSVRPSLSIGTAPVLSGAFPEGESFFVLPPAAIPLRVDSPLPRVNPLGPWAGTARKRTFISRSGRKHAGGYGHDLIGTRGQGFRDLSSISARAKRGRDIEETPAGVTDATQSILARDTMGEVEEALTATQSVHSDNADMSSHDNTIGRPSKVLRSLLRTRSFVHSSFSPAV